MIRSCSVKNVASTSESSESSESTSSDHDSDAPSRADTENFSDISDDSDLFHVSVKEDKSWTTRQDRELQAIRRIAQDLRDHPLLPPDPSDASKDFTLVDSGMKFPPAHCAYRGWRKH